MDKAGFEIPFDLQSKVFTKGLLGILIVSWNPWSPFPPCVCLSPARSDVGTNVQTSRMPTGGNHVDLMVHLPTWEKLVSLWWHVSVKHFTRWFFLLFNKSENILKKTSDNFPVFQEWNAPQICVIYDSLKPGIKVKSLVGVSGAEVEICGL